MNTKIKKSSASIAKKSLLLSLFLFSFFLFKTKAEAVVYFQTQSPFNPVGTFQHTSNPAAFVSTNASINPTGTSTIWIAFGLASSSIPIITSSGDTLYIHWYTGLPADAPTFQGYSQVNNYGSALVTSTIPDIYLLQIPNVDTTAGRYYDISDGGGHAALLSDASGETSVGWNQIPNGNYFFCMSSGVNDCTSPPGPPPTSLTFVWPQNGTTTAPFNNFILSANNVTTTDTYFVSVNYFIPQTSANLTSQSIQLTGAQILAQGLTVSKSPFGITLPNNTSSPVVAEATLFDTTNFQAPDNLNNFIVAATSTIFIQLQSGNNNPNGTSTYYYVTAFNQSGTIIAVPTQTNNPNLPQVSSSSYYCFAPNNITDIGGGIGYAGCLLSNYLFGTTQATGQGLSDAWNALQQTGPFAIIFGQEQSIENGITTASTTPVENNLIFHGSIIGGKTYNLPILTSSTLINIYKNDNCNTTCAIAEKDTTFGYERYIIWGMASIMAIKLIIF